MTTTTAAAAPGKQTPHDVHHLLLTEAERLADFLDPTTLRMIRARHRQRYPDCPASRRLAREGVNP